MASRNALNVLPLPLLLSFQLPLSIRRFPFHRSKSPLKCVQTAEFDEDGMPYPNVLREMYKRANFDYNTPSVDPDFVIYRGEVYRYKKRNGHNGTIVLERPNEALRYPRSHCCDAFFFDIRMKGKGTKKRSCNGNSANMQTKGPSQRKALDQSPSLKQTQMVSLGGTRKALFSPDVDASDSDTVSDCHDECETSRPHTDPRRFAAPSGREHSSVANNVSVPPEYVMMPGGELGYQSRTDLIRAYQRFSARHDALMNAREQLHLAQIAVDAANEEVRSMAADLDVLLLEHFGRAVDGGTKKSFISQFLDESQRHRQI